MQRTPHNHEETTVDLFTAAIGTTHFSPNLGAELTITGRSWHQPGVDDPRGLPADAVELSHDGQRWIDGWHRAELHGPESDLAIYVERHIRGGCSFHGWVDAASRRIVQTG